MSGVTREVIAEVRSRANIYEVVSELVALKRAGKQYKGLCPFHTEKTPSFHVNPDRGIFKCFGCNEGGDVFTFLERMKGLDFIDTVKELAQRYGVQLVESTYERNEYHRRNEILMLYQQAAQYYRRLLEDEHAGAAAREYLLARGIDAETSAKFNLGYAPDVWDGLLLYLTSQAKAAPATLVEAGLVRARDRGRGHYDLFRHRVMIPICDGEGRVIAFGGRALGDDKIKYLNSPETPIYTKGQHLFAFNLAKDEIRHKDAVIVVEGYFDAIMLHRHDFANSVATLGTALTARQARQLVRYTASRRVYLAFEGDSAGQRAVDRGVEILNQVVEGVGVELRILVLPGGKDPDDCLRLEGRAAFAEAQAVAPLIIDYQLDQAVKPFDLSTHTGSIEAARALVPVVGEIRDAVARGVYVRHWAERINVSEESLLFDVGQYRRWRVSNDVKFAPRQESVGSRPADPLEDAESSLLSLFLVSLEQFDFVSRQMADWHFDNPAHARIREAIEGAGSGFLSVDELFEELAVRLVLDREACQILNNRLIQKAEEIRRQDIDLSVLLADFQIKAYMLRLERVIGSLRRGEGRLNEADALIKVRELIRLRKLLQFGVEGMDAFRELKGKIDLVLA